MISNDRTPNPAAVLLARLWSIEECDGGWNGADTVDVVCEWLGEQGLNITHPAETATGDLEDRESWEFAELLNVAQRQTEAR